MEQEPNKRLGPSEDLPPTWRYKKTKAQLLEEARKNYLSPPYKIQKMASMFEASTLKIEFSFLSVAYPKLNPIETLRGVIERKVAERNVNFNLAEVESSTQSEYCGTATV